MPVMTTDASVSTPAPHWTSSIPSDLWLAAAESMPWFRPRARRKRLRVVLHAQFFPPNEKGKASLMALVKFHDFANLVESRRLALRSAAADLYLARQDKLLKILTLFNSAGGDQGKLQRVAAAVKRMRLSPVEKEAIHEELKSLVSGTEPKRPPVSAPADPAPRTAKAIREEGRLLDKMKPWPDFLARLAIAAGTGDEVSARELQNLAHDAVMQLTAASRKCPQVFRRLAAKSDLWPVMASTDPAWPRRAQQILRDLELGGNSLYSRLKPALAFDREVPARAWAKSAFETLELNRGRFAEPNYEKTLTLLNGDHAINLAPIPDWARAAGKLPPLSRTTAKHWAALSRDMIRDQCPNLEKHPDWTSVGRRYAHLTTADGVVRNKILDAIGSALFSIARSELPKTDSRISADQKR